AGKVRRQEGQHGEVPLLAALHERPDRRHQRGLQHQGFGDGGHPFGQEPGGGCGDRRPDHQGVGSRRGRPQGGGIGEEGQGRRQEEVCGEEGFVVL
ncbi:MAG: hypothetical protein AVDCRST_MAG10-1353, partial [uncultured Acidimicrobiales bacterium]